MSALHFGDVSRAPSMMFLHANGFNAQSYATLLGLLAAQEDTHIIALDLRGQGQSVGFDNQPNTLRDFTPFADDVAQILQRDIDAPVLMVGHSLGGIVGMLAARNVPEKVNGFLGLDPVSVPGIVRLLPRLPGGRALLKNSFGWAKAAGRRRAKFDSLDAAFTHYSGRGTFKFLPDQVTRDYLEGGTIASDGGITLSCHPLWEQAVYGAQANDIFGAAKALPVNSRFIFAGKQAASTPMTRGKMGRIIGKDKVIFKPDYSHFFPLIQQDETRALLSEAIVAS